ncbi:hypothetical protein GCM10010428_66640 [Actinosynnema pretiosum subsp. pretiosum]
MRLASCGGDQVAGSATPGSAWAITAVVGTAVTEAATSAAAQERSTNPRSILRLTRIPLANWHAPRRPALRNSLVKPGRTGTNGERPQAHSESASGFGTVVPIIG